MLIYPGFEDLNQKMTIIRSSTPLFAAWISAWSVVPYPLSAVVNPYSDKGLNEVQFNESLSSAVQLPSHPHKGERWIKEILTIMEIEHREAALWFLVVGFREVDGDRAR